MCDIIGASLPLNVTSITSLLTIICVIIINLFYVVSDTHLYTLFFLMVVIAPKNKLLKHFILSR
jgi:hypothetical protein